MRRVALYLFAFVLLNSTFHAELTDAAFAGSILLFLASLLPVSIQDKAKTPIAINHQALEFL